MKLVKSLRGLFEPLRLVPKVELVIKHSTDAATMHHTLGMSSPAVFDYGRAELERALPGNAWSKPSGQCATRVEISWRARLAGTYGQGGLAAYRIEGVVKITDTASGRVRVTRSFVGAEPPDQIYTLPTDRDRSALHGAYPVDAISRYLASLYTDPRP